MFPYIFYQRKSVKSVDRIEKIYHFINFNYLAVIWITHIKMMNTLVITYTEIMGF